MEDNREEQDLPAGEFSAWLQGMRDALQGQADSDVPCDGCTACCTSSQFVHIGPDETKTLSRIPKELLFPAPRMPAGHALLGYDERGHCPMLRDGRCSIYEDRPRTCRTYDCRVFAAAGLSIEDDDKVLIGRRAGRWRFEFPSETSRYEREAVRAAARFIRAQEDVLFEGPGATTTTQIAVLAVEVHDAFLRHDAETGRPSGVANPDIDEVRVALTRRD
jgi:Fe-S-cluster containining protein